jgi:uncharacterized protein YggE
MKAKVLLLLLMSSAFAAIALAQDSATMVPPNTVYVGADGKFEADPDTALLQFNIAAQQSTAKAAYDRASKSAEQVREILCANGIEPKAAQLGYYSIEPVQEYVKDKQKLVGYKVSTSVTMKLKDFSKVAPVVQQLSDADITDTNSVTYTLDDTDAAKAKAVQDAYRRARQSAEAVAEAGGRALGPLSSATVDIQENMRIMPMARQESKMSPMMAAPAPTQEFSPQTVSVTAHVNATFSLK